MYDFTDLREALRADRCVSDRAIRALTFLEERIAELEQAVEIWKERAEAAQARVPPHSDVLVDQHIADLISRLEYAQHSGGDNWQTLIEVKRSCAEAAIALAAQAREIARLKDGV